MRRAYNQVLLSELRSNIWRFAVKRANLAASGTPPVHGKANLFPLPGDFVRIAPEGTTYDAPARRDWEIEGTAIASDDSAPLPLRYVSSSVTEAMFDVLFAEALSARLAMETCEELTNSNSKVQNAQRVYTAKILDAKKCNSIESAPIKQPTVSWITTRM